MRLFDDGWRQRELKNQLQGLEEEELVVRCWLLAANKEGRILRQIIGKRHPCFNPNVWIGVPRTRSRLEYPTYCDDVAVGVVRASKYKRVSKVCDAESEGDDDGR